MTDYTELKRLAEAATQGEWQVIETELPCRIGRPHVERRIFTAKNHPQLKAPYPVVNGSVALGTDETLVHHMVSMTAEDAAYIAAANPAAVKSLIAENERLTHVSGCHLLRAQTMEVERDHLKAEVAGLKTGYEAYERVNAELEQKVANLEVCQTASLGMSGVIKCVAGELGFDASGEDSAQDYLIGLARQASGLKAECEALRKDAARYRRMRAMTLAQMDDTTDDFDSGFDSQLDAAMVQGERS